MANSAFGTVVGRQHYPGPAVGLHHSHVVPLGHALSSEEVDFPVYEEHGSAFAGLGATAGERLDGPEEGESGGGVVDAFGVDFLEWAFFFGHDAEDGSLVGFCVFVGVAAFEEVAGTWESFAAE